MIDIDIEKTNRFNFRNCLACLSHPGSIYPITPLFDSPLQALASVLLYTEVGYYYDGKLDFQMMAALTGAKPQAPEKADYLFFDAPNVPVLKLAKTGTAENPESSASLLFYCNDVTEGLSVTLSGPGIDGSFQTRLPVDQDFIAELQEINSDFPIGIDLFFIDSENRILGLPRTTNIEVLV